VTWYGLAWSAHEALRDREMIVLLVSFALVVAALRNDALCARQLYWSCSAASCLCFVANVAVVGAPSAPRAVSLLTCSAGN
jgi:hypothetical protein